MRPTSTTSRWTSPGAGLGGGVREDEEEANKPASMTSASRRRRSSAAPSCRFDQLGSSRRTRSSRASLDSTQTGFGIRPSCSSSSSSLIIACLAFLTASHLCCQSAAADTQLALLSGTLKTVQRASCDGQMLEILCPPNTSIAIQFAQYGRHSVSPDTGGGPVLCPPGRAASAPVASLEPDVMAKYNVTCFAKKALQTVVDKCQKENSCQVYTTMTSFGEDPCPGIRKYLEVAYKCGPTIFQNKVMCQGERATLSCPANFRLVIYSADFGRTVAGELKCPQTRGVPREDCRASYATESVMQNCHGRRRCHLSADVGTFGAPCNPKSYMYLKVVYTCVPREVLKEPFQQRLEPDEDGYSTSGDGGVDSNAVGGAAGGPLAPSGGNRSGGEPTSYDVDEVKGSVVPDWKQVTPKSAAGVQGAATSGAQSENQGWTKRGQSPKIHFERPETTMPQDAVPAYSPTGGGGGGPDVRSSAATVKNGHKVSPSSAGGSSVNSLSSSRPYTRDDASKPGFVSGSSSLSPPASSNRQDFGTSADRKQQSSSSSELVGDWIQTYQYLRENHETLVLYLSLSVAGGILLFCAALVTKLMVSRTTTSNSTAAGRGTSPSRGSSGAASAFRHTSLGNAGGVGGGCDEDDDEMALGMDADADASMDVDVGGGSATSILIKPLTASSSSRTALVSAASSPTRRTAGLYQTASSSSSGGLLMPHHYQQQQQHPHHHQQQQQQQQHQQAVLMMGGGAPSPAGSTATACSSDRAVVIGVHHNPLSQVSTPHHLALHQQQQQRQHVTTASALCPPAPFADGVGSSSEHHPHHQTQQQHSSSGVGDGGQSAATSPTTTTAVIVDASGAAYPAMIGADSLEVVRYTQLLGTLRRQQNIRGGESQPPRSFSHRLPDDSHLYS